MSVVAVPQIVINEDTLNVDNTSITMDTIEDPYKDYGPSIVDNLVDYTSYEVLPLFLSPLLNFILRE